MIACHDSLGRAPARDRRPEPAAPKAASRRDRPASAPPTSPFGGGRAAPSVWAGKAHGGPATGFVPPEPLATATLIAGAVRLPAVGLAVLLGGLTVMFRPMGETPLAVLTAAWVVLGLAAAPVYLAWLRRAVANLPALRASLAPPAAGVVVVSHLLPALGLGWGWSVARRTALNSRPDLIPGQMGTLGTYDAPLAGWVYAAMATTGALLVLGAVLAALPVDGRFAAGTLAAAALSDLTQLLLGSVFVAWVTRDQTARRDAV